MGSKWDGKIGKVPGIGQKRDSKRMSPRVPKDPFAEKTGINETRDSTLYDEDTGTGNPKQPGEVDLYSPETVSQYKSQWARYERALELVPSAIQPEGRHLIYKFASDSSITGFWEVKVRPGATYLNITKPEWQIMCPPEELYLSCVESDGESFEWSQIKGSRSVLFEPSTDINPNIIILTFCNGNGCRDDSVEPIVLKVQPDQQPELFDTITIYTTPTSTHWGNSFEVAIAAPDVDPQRRVTTSKPAAPPPQYLQRGYAVNPAGTYMFTWDLPAADQSFLTGTVWQKNTTGQYLDVEQFSSLDNRLFIASLNTHYRVLSVYNVHGNVSAVDSNRFYFTNGNRVVVADDSLDGLSYAGLKNSITKLPLGRKGLSVEDKLDGISATGLKSSIIKLPLSRKLLQPPDDTYDGISYQALKSKVEKLNLGGMIIR